MKFKSLLIAALYQRALASLQPPKTDVVKSKKQKALDAFFAKNPFGAHTEAHAELVNILFEYKPTVAGVKYAKLGEAFVFNGQVQIVVYNGLGFSGVPNQTLNLNSYVIIPANRMQIESFFANQVNVTNEEFVNWVSQRVGQAAIGPLVSLLSEVVS